MSIENITVKVNVDLSAVEAAEARVAALQNISISAGTSGRALGAGAGAGALGAGVPWARPALIPKWDLGPYIMTGDGKVYSGRAAGAFKDAIDELAKQKSTLSPPTIAGNLTTVIPDPSLIPKTEFSPQLIKGKQGMFFTPAPNIFPATIDGDPFDGVIPRTASQIYGTMPTQVIPKPVDPQRNMFHPRSTSGYTTLFSGEKLNIRQILSGARATFSPRNIIYGGAVAALVMKPLQDLAQNFNKRIADSPKSSYQDLAREAATDTLHEYGALAHSIVKAPIQLYLDASQGLGVAGQALFGIGNPRPVFEPIPTLSVRRKIQANAGEFHGRSVFWNAAFSDAVKEIPDRIEGELQSIHSRLESTGFRVERFLVDREYKEAAERKVRERFSDEQERLRPKYTQSEGIRSGGNR